LNWLLFDSALSSTLGDLAGRNVTNRGFDRRCSLGGNGVRCYSGQQGPFMGIEAGQSGRH
jgi:hypothetical protein